MEVLNFGFYDIKITFTTNYTIMAGNTFGNLFKLTTFGESHGVAIGGVFAGILCIFIFIQLTLSDAGTLDESDGAKSIGLSFIQLISLLVTFPIAW